MPFLSDETKASRERQRHEFAQRLNEAMTAAQMTQAELAKASGIPQSNLSAMMNGRLGASLERLMGLARALHVEPTALMPYGEVEGLAPAENNSDGTPKKRYPVERGIGPKLGVHGKHPAQTWIAWARSDRSVTLPQGLGTYFEKNQSTLTLEMATALAGDTTYAIKGLVKDEAYWDRRREQLQKEIDLVRAAQAETGQHEKAPVKPGEGESNDRTRLRHPPVRKLPR